MVYGKSGILKNSFSTIVIIVINAKLARCCGHNKFIITTRCYSWLYISIYNIYSLQTITSEKLPREGEMGDR